MECDIKRWTKSSSLLIRQHSHQNQQEICLINECDKSFCLLILVKETSQRTIKLLVIDLKCTFHITFSFLL